MSTTLTSAALQTALELVSQPEFFPLEQGTVAVAPRGRYTGERSTLDEEKVLVICALRELGLSDRKIAKIAGCARESIPMHLAEGERRGLIRPLKERLIANLGLLSEEAVAAARELTEDVRNGNRDEGVTMSLRALGPMVGITVEKLQLLMGGATEIVEQRSGPTREEWMREYGRKLVDVQSWESQSPDVAAKSLISTGYRERDTQDDTVKDAEVVPDGARAADAEEGGRGSRQAGAIESSDGSTRSQNFGHGADAEWVEGEVKRNGCELKDASALMPPNSPSPEREQSAGSAVLPTGPAITGGHSNQIP